MDTQSLEPCEDKRVLKAQRSEITEHFIYKKLSQSIRNPHNQHILVQISKDELRHYQFLKSCTRKDMKPNRLKIWLYFVISRVLGLTFGIKLMERGEEKALLGYREISGFIPHAQKVIMDEDKHEHQLIEMIDEERLNYTGAIVRGLNEALVELTGALSGLTLAFRKPEFIATAGLITGAAMCLSLSSTEYLATKHESGDHHPIKAALYTGLANMFTVFVLIFPYFLFNDIYFSLGVMLFNAIIVIYIFNFYISIAKNLSWKKRFLEMTLISIGIAVLTFSIGYLARILFHIEI
jgi:VIT1/CCC1 family predicted Fe2+/Mn2+ transporter